MKKNIVYFLFVLLTCCKSTKKSIRHRDPQIPKKEQKQNNQDIENTIERLKKIKRFKFGQLRNLMDINKLSKYISAKNKFKVKKKFNIYFFFVDTLREDFITSELTPNIVQFRKDGISFKQGIAASSVTHLSSYSIFYSRHAYERNIMLAQTDDLWTKGSPYLNMLKNSGYKLHLFGTNWQYGININTKERFLEKNVLNNYVEPNLFLLYGRKTSSLFSTYYQQGFLKGGDPAIVLGLPSIVPKVPSAFEKPSPWLTPETPLREIQNRLLSFDSSWIERIEQYKGAEKDVVTDSSLYLERNSAKLDDSIVSDGMEHITEKVNDTKNKWGNFYLFYLFSVHDKYAWLDSTLLSKPFEPNFEWDPFLSKRPPKDASEEEKTTWKKKMLNSYKNAVKGIDYQFGRFIKKLKELGEYENSIIVFFSDHGEFLFDKNLKDRDRVGHCCDIYKANTHVPIYFKFPPSEKVERIKKRDSLGLVSHLDIFPSVIDFLEMENYSFYKENYAQGKSIFKNERKCSISWNPFGNKFSFVNAQTRLNLVLDHPKSILNSGGVVYEDLKSIDDDKLEFGNFLEDDQKNTYEYIERNYPLCLYEAFLINERKEYVIPPKALYKQRLKEMKSRSLKLNEDLLVITPENDEIYWNSDRTKIKVSFVTNKKNFHNLQTIGNRYTPNSDFWVTVAPELKRFCTNSIFHHKKLEMAVKQVLGLKPNYKLESIVDAWVDIKRLKRPCSNPSIDVNGCEAIEQNKSEELSLLFEKLKNYPFSGLGYTFDWTRNFDEQEYFGLSEFIVDQQTTLEIDSISNIASYCDKVTVKF